MPIAPLDRRVIVASGPKEFCDAARLSELERCRYLVLLGEPGLGKTEALRFLANRSGASIQSSSFFDMGIHETLFVDGLDEVSLEDAIKIGTTFFRAKQPRWRVTCRVEAWSSDGKLGKAFGSTHAAVDEEPVIAYLQQLTSEEVDEVLIALGCVNATLLLSRLQSLGSTPFVSSPLGLKFLASLPEGHLQVSSRADLYELGVTALAEEHNDFRAEDVNRLPVSKLLDLAGHIFLMLLLCGKHGVRKRAKDERTLNGESLGVTPQELDYVLDTALFVRDGEIFTAMHRSVQEYLAARYLSRAVAGYTNGTKIPSFRALALFESLDGRPPSNLKPLYAWYATNLESIGFENEAMTLLQRDSECILVFGDSAKFNVDARRYLLEEMGRRDPYFQDVRNTSLMSLAGLITEEVAETAALILSDPSESPHRLSTTLQAISDSLPIRRLGSLCREVILRNSKNYWCASQALKAWAHCLDPSSEDVWALVDELKKMIVEDSDEFRYRLIAQAFVILPSISLTQKDVHRLIHVLTTTVTTVRPGIYAVRDISWHIARSPIWQSLILGAPYAWSLEHGQGSVQHRLAGGICIAILALDEYISSTDMAKMLVATGCITGPKSPPSFEVSAKNWLAQRQDYDDIARALCGVIDSRVIQHGSVASGFKFIGLKPSLSFCNWMLTDEELLIRLGADYVGCQAIRIYTDQDDVPLGELVSLLGAIKESPTTQAAQLQLQRYLSLLDEKSVERDDGIEDYIASLVVKMNDSSVSLSDEEVEHVAFWGGALYCGEYWPPGASPHRSGIEAVRALFGDSLIEPVASLLVSAYKSESSTERNVLVAGLDLLLERGEISALSEIAAGQLLRTFDASCSVRNPPRREVVKQFCLDELSKIAGLNPEYLEREFTEDYISISLARSSALWSLPNGFHAWFSRRMLERVDWVGRVSLTDILDVSSRNLSSVECVDAANRLMPLFLSGYSSVRADRELLSLVFWATKLDAKSFGSQLTLLLPRFSREVIYQSILSDYQSHIFGLDDSVKVEISSILMDYFVTCDSHVGWYGGNYWVDVKKVLDVLVISDRMSALECLVKLHAQSVSMDWKSQLAHEIERSRRLRRDQAVKIFLPEDVLLVLAGRGPVSAFDLRALIVSELESISTEIQSSSLNDWRLYWEGNGDKLTPKVENDCRDAIALRLRERLRLYGSFSVDPESASSGYTRADIKISFKSLSVAIEVKRTSHSHLWHGHTGQLQTYTLDSSMSGQGIYLVFWFGIGFSVTNRPDGRAAPKDPRDLESALIKALDDKLVGTTSVVVIDASNASERAKARKQDDFMLAKAQRSGARKTRKGNAQE